MPILHALITLFAVSLALASDECPESTSLLQVNMVVQGRTLVQSEQERMSAGAHARSQHENGNIMALEEGIESCTNMDNHDTYFSINVTIGEADIGESVQTFPLVADTGSNAIVVPDCSCKLRGCSAATTCFEPNKSSSFRLLSHTDASGKNHTALEKLTYGSGSIEVEVASDLAKVGNVVANMTDGIYLMVDRRKLLIEGEFEGILGLGLPGSLDHTPLFAQASGVKTYTLCFNDQAKPGVLKMNVGALAKPMTNIGEVHWGLDLQGMSVGDKSAPALFCNPATKKPHMKTACGAIPDSGTTLMLGAKEQVLSLQATICDQWPRCKNASLNLPTVKKAEVFHRLLFRCDDWLKENPDELSTMPPIYITLAGAEGVPQKIKIPATAYVLETEEQLFKDVVVKILGVLPVSLPIGTGVVGKVCMSAFDVQQYNTIRNGPVWILGTPLFYTHTLGYDIGSVPPKISVESKPCVECGANSLTKQEAVRTSLRKVKGPLRQKRWSVSELL